MYFIPFIITILVLLFESISDIKTMKTYTLPIYMACIINIVIKILYKVSNGSTAELKYMCMFIILFGICCYCSSYLTHRQLGAGDFDIIFLIFITQPLFAVIVLVSSIIMFIKHCIIIPKGQTTLNNDVSQEQTKLSEILAIKISFVPVLFIGYIISIIFTGLGAML